MLYLSSVTMKTVYACSYKIGVGLIKIYERSHNMFCNHVPSLIIVRHCSCRLQQSKLCNYNGFTGFSHWSLCLGGGVAIQSRGVWGNALKVIY